MLDKIIRAKDLKRTSDEDDCRKTTLHKCAMGLLHKHVVEQRKQYHLIGQAEMASM